jgi:hypothetical protein
MGGCRRICEACLEVIIQSFGDVWGTRDRWTDEMANERFRGGWHYPTKSRPRNGSEPVVCLDKYT